MKRICLLLPFLFLFCGCYPYTEVENMDILTSVYIGKPDGEVQLGGGVANVRSFSDAMADEPVSLISAKGEDLEAAILNLQQSADHPLFFGAMRAVILEENFAEENILPFVRYLDTEPRSRRSTAVFVTDADLETVVKHKAVNDFSAGFAADSIITTLYEAGLVHYTSMGDVLYAVSYGDAGYPVARIAVDGDVMRLDGYALFRGGEMVGSTHNSALVCFTQKKAALRHVLNGIPIETAVKNKEIKLQERNGILYVQADFTFAARTQDATPLRAGQINILKDKLHTALTTVLEESRKLGCDFLQLYKIQMTKGRTDFDMKGWNTKISQMEFLVNVEVKAE